MMRNLLFMAVLCLCSTVAPAQGPIVLKSYEMYTGSFVNDDLVFQKPAKPQELVFLIFDDNIQVNDTEDTKFYYTSELQSKKGVANDGDPFKQLSWTVGSW